MINSKNYKERFSVPDPSGAPTAEMIQRRAEAGKKSSVKRILTAVFALVALFVLSNGVSYAATGETWVYKIIYSAVLPSGVKVEIKQDANGGIHGAAEFHDGDIKDKDYTVYENGRTYFVFGSFKTDISDIVAGGKDYYKYEYTDSQGFLHRIFVGEMPLAEEYVGGPLVHCSAWHEVIYFEGRADGVGSGVSGDEEWWQKAMQDYPMKPQK